MASDPQVPIISGGGNFTVYSLDTGNLISDGDVYGMDYTTQIQDPDTQGIVNYRLDLQEFVSNWYLPTGTSYLDLFKINLATLMIELRDPDTDSDVLHLYIQSALSDMNAQAVELRRRVISSALGPKYCFWLIADGDFPPFFNQEYTFDMLKHGLSYAALDPNAEIEFLVKPWDNPTSPSGEFVRLNQSQCAILARDIYCWFYTLDAFMLDFTFQLGNATSIQDIFDIVTAFNPPTEPQIPPPFVEE